MIELSQGFTGHLSTTEGYFYGLDALPLLLAIAIYVPIWPGRYVPDGLDLNYASVDHEAQNSTMKLTDFHSRG